MTQTPPPGWYTDPANGTGMRWWDGNAWSMHTQPVAPQPVGAQPVAQPVTAPQAYGTAPATYPPASQFGTPTYGQTQPGAPAPYTAWQPTPGRARSSNHYAFITFGVVALYLVLAAFAHIVFIGIVPILMSIRSFQAKESLAPVAIGAAVVSIVVSLTVLTGH
jgi:hypothetical protein